MADEIQKLLQGTVEATVKNDLVEGEPGFLYDQDFNKLIYRIKNNGGGAIFEEFLSETWLAKTDSTGEGGTGSGSEKIGLDETNLQQISGSELQSAIESIDTLLNGLIVGDGGVENTVITKILATAPLLQDVTANNTLLNSDITSVLKITSDDIPDNRTCGLKAGAFDGHRLLIYPGGVDTNNGIEINDSVSGSASVINALTLPKIPDDAISLWLIWDATANGWYYLDKGTF